MPPINWSVVGPILAVALVALNTVLTVVIAKWANAPKWLRVVQGLLADIITNIPGVPGSQTHTAINYQPPVIGQPVKTSAGSTPIGKITVIALALFLAGSAHAQVVSSGPSLAFMELRPGYAHPVQIGAGAGYQLSVGFFPTLVLNQEADLLDLGGTIYGSLVSAPSGAAAGSLSLALFVGTLNEIVAIGIAEDLIPAAGNILSTPPYAVLMFNPLRIAFGSPPSSNAAGAEGVSSVHRFATLYLGL